MSFEQRVLVQRLAIGAIFVAWVMALVEAWPVLVSRLSASQWMTGGLMHLGTILAFASIERRSRDVPQEPAMTMRMLMACCLMSWSFAASVISKLA